MTYLMEHGMRLVDGSNSTSTKWKALKEGAYWLHVGGQITQWKSKRLYHGLYCLVYPLGYESYDGTRIFIQVQQISSF